MNLPTVAIILEEHSLAKIYGANRIVHLVNSRIADSDKHITTTMRGRDITALYKSLDYTEQLMLVELDVYDDKETDMLITQIELLNSATDTEGRMSATLRGLIVSFVATLMFLVAVTISIMYYENARQNNAVVDSRLFALVVTIMANYNP